MNRKSHNKTPLKATYYQMGELALINSELVLAMNSLAESAFVIRKCIVRIEAVRSEITNRKAGKQ